MKVVQEPFAIMTSCKFWEHFMSNFKKHNNNYKHTEPCGCVHWQYGFSLMRCFEFWIPSLSGVEVLLWQHIMVEKKSYGLERHTNPNVNLSSTTFVLTGWASYLTSLVKWKLYFSRDAMKMKAPKVSSC